MEKVILPESWQEWEIVEKIGSGAFGVVYKARRTIGKQEFISAIKIIHVPPEESEVEEIKRQMGNEQSARAYFSDMVDGYIREINTMDELKGNSNIVSVEDYAVIEDTDQIGWTIYIRMEYLQSFAKYMSEASVTEEEVIKLGIDICSALECCEQLHILHRDIKPDNIFIAPLGQYKLGDFGEARQLDRSLSSNSSRGTFSYMAPEVYYGKEYGLQADIYSLGITLYRLMNHNREPFINPYKQLVTYSEREEAMHRRMSGEQLEPPEMASEPLAKVILKACAYEPEERYRNAAEMKQDLLALQNPQRQETEPEGQEQRQTQDQTQSVDEKGKNPQHNNRRTGAMLFSALLLIAVIIILVVLFVRRNGNKEAEPEYPETETELISDSKISAASDEQADEQIEIRKNDSGDTFEGVFDDEGYLDGWGICEYSNGDIFEGNFSHGVRDGYGLYYEQSTGNIDAKKYFPVSNGYGFNYAVANYSEYQGVFFSQNYYDSLNERWIVNVYDDSDCHYCVECDVSDGSVTGERVKMYFFYYADGTYELAFFDDDGNQMNNEELTSTLSDGTIEIGYFDNPDTGDGIWFYDYGSSYEFYSSVNGSFSSTSVCVFENENIVMGDVEDGTFNGDAIEYTGDGYEIGECVDGYFEGEALFCNFADGQFYKDQYSSGELIDSGLLSFPNGISGETRSDANEDENHDSTISSYSGGLGGIW